MILSEMNISIVGLGKRLIRRTSLIRPTRVITYRKRVESVGFIYLFCFFLDIGGAGEEVGFDDKVSNE